MELGLWNSICAKFDQKQVIGIYNPAQIPPYFHDPKSIEKSNRVLIGGENIAWSSVSIYCHSRYDKLFRFDVFI